jgi:hypothetical protein
VQFDAAPAFETITEEMSPSADNGGLADDVALAEQGIDGGPHAQRRAS